MQRTRTIAWDDPESHDRASVASLSGLEYLEGIRNGSIKPPPVAALVGYRVAEAGKGYALFELEPAEYHYNPFSTVHGGILATLMDTAMAASVLTTLPPGVSCATIEIKVNFIRPVTARTGVLRCEGRPLNVGRHLATVEGRLEDGDGNLCAHGVGTCSIFKIRP